MDNSGNNICDAANLNSESRWSGDVQTDMYLPNIPAKANEARQDGKNTHNNPWLLLTQDGCQAYLDKVCRAKRLFVVETRE
jgi:hypothetical protein